MTLDEFTEKVGMMFPQQPKESKEHYRFYMREAMSPFQGKAGLDKAWEQVRMYSGQKNRPDLAFFQGIADGTRSDAKVFQYFQCECGEKLAFSSGGACPTCGRIGGKLRTSMKPVHVLAAQSGCFDCTAYRDTAMGPSCADFGTPRFNECRYRSECPCMHCCRFEFLRRYHPERLREDFQRTMKMLPPAKSEAGKAFQEGRASVEDVNGMLKWKEQKAKREAEAKKKAKVTTWDD